MIKSSSCVVFTLLFVLCISLTSFAQTAPQKDFPNVNIKNFGQMDENFYRGGQPDKDDYQSLAALGIKTVIDLREDPKDYEKPAVEAAGMKYINIPMSDKKYPKPENIEMILKIINDPETGKFFVHCAGGRHRTGIAGALYRFTKYNWDYDRVYSEMKNYDFYSRWGHGPMKDFVIDYAEKLKTSQANAENPNSITTNIEIVK